MPYSGESIENECIEYLTFTSNDIIIVNQPQNRNSSMLHISLYILLPQSAVKAPFRNTDYVVPRDTLHKIARDNKVPITAIVRDSIKERLLQVSKDLWKPIALTFLSIIGTGLLLAIIITFFQRKYSYKRKGRLSVFDSNDTTVQEISPPIKPGTVAPTPSDGCSLINVSENGEDRSGSEQSSCAGETADPPNHLLLLKMRSEFNHPFANNDTENSIT